MYHISATHRCHLFEQIATDVWNKIIHHHATGIEVPETGITNDIVSLIRSHYYSPVNFGVWANNGKNEGDTGCDIEIYVETTSNSFALFALQAKVLARNGRYKQLRHTNDSGEYQWELLERLKAKIRCHIRYLLYNGVKDYKHSGTDCAGAFNEDQYGCSLVHVSDIKRLALRKKGKHFINPMFCDLHPALAAPWRQLTCCYQSEADQDLFSYAQIYKMTRQFEPIVTPRREPALLDLNVSQEKNRASDEQVGYLVKESNPKLRIAVTHTYS